MGVTSDQLISGMRALSPLPYRQQLGTWDSKLGNYRRPDPTKVKYGDCTSVIQHVYLDGSDDAIDPGYYTGDMRTRGTLVADSTRGNFDAIKPGDVLLMRWHSGTWHAELAIDSYQCIGHPGPGAGPTTKNLRTYLGSAAYWEARRHPIDDHLPKPPPEPEYDMSKPQNYQDKRARNGDMILKPGADRKLSQNAKASATAVLNVTQKVPGTHTTFGYAYFKGEPGDMLALSFLGQDRDVTPHKTAVMHTVYGRVQDNGLGRMMIAEPLYRKSLDRRHYLRAMALKSNKKPITVTLLDAKSVPTN